MDVEERYKRFGDNTWDDCGRADLSKPQQRVPKLFEYSSNNRHGRLRETIELFNEGFKKCFKQWFVGCPASSSKVLVTACVDRSVTHIFKAARPGSNPSTKLHNPEYYHNATRAVEKQRKGTDSLKLPETLA